MRRHWSSPALELKLISLAFLVLRPLESDGNWTVASLKSQAFGLRLELTPSASLVPDLWA